MPGIEAACNPANCINMGHQFTAALNLKRLIREVQDLGIICTFMNLPNYL